MQMTAFAVGSLTPAAIDGVPVDPFFDDWCNFCLPANLTGFPATTVPCGYDADGLPIGLQVMGPRGADDWTLSVAAAWEAQFASRRRWPA
jgi:aspartyl-tRNA(Asn)/glutamyl-tRNA(Gln) amidotransferase subunit A